MSLEQTFYLFGLVYMAAWLIFLIALIIAVIIIFRRIQDIRTTVENSAVATVGRKLLSPPSLKGILAVLPVVQLLYKKFKNRRKS